MTPGHILFVVALGISWLAACMHIVLSDRPMYAASAASIALPVRSGRLAVLLLLSVGYAAAVWGWAGSSSPRVGAVVVLFALLGLRQVEKRLWPDDRVIRLGKYVPTAACLLAWLVASTLFLATGSTEEAADAAGWHAAAGVIAAIYTVAGISKLKLTGVGWAAPHHQALLIAERAYSGPKGVRKIRRWAAGQPAVCRVVGSFGLLSEFACAFYVIPALRLPITVAVLALHGGIMLLLGYVEPEWWAVMVAVTLISQGLP